MLRGRAYSTCEVQDSTPGAMPAVAAGTGGVEASKLVTSLNLNGDLDIGEINLSEMNPDDIRVSSAVCITIYSGTFVLLRLLLSTLETGCLLFFRPLLLLLLLLSPWFVYCFMLMAVCRVKRKDERLN